MRFMSLVKSRENMGPPPKELMDAMDQLAADGFKSGTLVDMGGLLPSTTGARIRISKGKISITDGPFTEAKEVIGGYAVLQAASREEAIEITRVFMVLHQKHWPEWEGESELRPIFDPADIPPQ